MKRQRIVLNPKQRKCACDEFVKALTDREVEVDAFCVGAKHWHGLLRFRDPHLHQKMDRDADLLLGQAKGKSARMMSKFGVIDAVGVWAKKGKVKPIRDEKHLERVRGYIPDHARKGAATHVSPMAKPGASAPGN